MLRKSFFIFLLAFIFFFCCPSESIGAKAAKKDLFTGQLKNVNSYQLGTDEFVLKFSGKNLPLPSIETDENLLLIILPDTKAANVKKINLLMSEFHQEVPAITAFKAENISEDQEWRVEISVETDRMLESPSMTRSWDGFSLRAKLQKDESNIVKLEPVKRVLNQPDTFLPFPMSYNVNTEFREADLRDIFRLIMADSGRNVIIDDSFPKDVIISLSLVDIKAEEILNYLMSQYEIACCLAGKNTIVFGTRESLSRLSGTREIKSFKIAHADLTALGTMLKNLTGLTDAEYTQDERMRIVHIKTNPAKMDLVEDAIKRLDVPAQQVMIRASIFEFSDSVTKDVQTAIEAVYDKWTFTSDPYGGSGVINYLDETYRNGKTNFNRTITATLQALENRGKGRTIANPSVIAVDGQEATISLKQDILYSKGTDDEGHQEWDTVEVGPELKFTPKIEANGYVYLDVEINTGDYLGKDTDDNIQTTTREVKTKIRVRDGMPFVVGGLNQDGHIITEAKIPVLGDIPLLGELFKWKNDEHNKTQAVMIVTPYILN